MNNGRYSKLQDLIDPGHGGNDPGAEYEIYTEKQFALEMAKHVRERLVSYGASTQMSRETDVTLSLEARVQMAINFKADIFVSVHVNTGSGAGIEIWKHDNANSSTINGNKQGW